MAGTASGLEHVQVTVEDEVATLTLNRPDAGNSLTHEVLAELDAALDSAASEDRAHPLVVTGAGRAFSTGGDLAVLLEGLERSRDEAVADADASLAALADVIMRLRRHPAPTIAAVNGQAAGAGFSLALACDIRIASARAAFHFAYGALGTSPDGGMTWFLPRVVSPARAAELLIEQPVLRAPRALEEGIVSEVVPADELLEAARKRAGRLAAKAPHSVRTARPLIESGAEATLAEQLVREREEFAAAVRTDDFRAGVAAVMEGRRPVFSGH